MGRKKIILLATSDINYDQRVQKIALSLQNFGADVHVMGRELSSSVPLLKKPYTQERLRCFFNKGMLFYLEINLRFFFHLIYNSYDTVCSNDPDTLIAAIKAKLFKKLDLIYDSHEYFTEVPELEGRKFKKNIWNAIERNGVKKAKQCYTVNDSIANILEKKYAKPIQVLRNVPRMEPWIAPFNDDKFIVYQGALNKGRGLEQLIEAMAVIPLRLVIAGKGDLEGLLKQQVEKLDLANKVEFLGNVTPKELREITKEAWLGYNLLESVGLSYYYSLSNKFFDYMHAEIPSLNMNFPEYQNILSQHELGLAIQELNVEEISKTINVLLADKQLYNRLKSNCKRAKEEFNWQKESQKLKKIYDL